jgi:hypothetical protein
MVTSLVNQRHRLIAILLQFHKAKIEDLVTIRNLLFYLHPWILDLFNWKYSSNSKNYVSQFHNPIFQFQIDLWI